MSLPFLTMFVLVVTLICDLQNSLCINCRTTHNTSNSIQTNHI